MPGRQLNELIKGMERKKKKTGAGGSTQNHRTDLSKEQHIQWVFQGSSKGLLCCLPRQEVDTEKIYQEDMDRVEAAFKRLDTDGDGFIDWQEFKQV